MKKRVGRATIVVLAIVGMGASVGCSSSASGETDVSASATKATNVAATEKPTKSEAGMPAMKKAAAAKKYLFVLFLKAEDAQTSAMRTTLQDAMKKVADKANSVEVDITAASEKAIVDEFGLDRAPMPLILAIAPNGAVMGGFPMQVKKQELLDCFASPGTEQCMKQLQKNRLVLLCVQNEKTKSNKEAMQGVRDFKADARFAKATEIIMLDPTDTAEAHFLKDLQIDPKTATAVTVFLAPPGASLAIYEGATNKEEMATTLQKSSSGCGPGGCGPGGCAPK